MKQGTTFRIFLAACSRTPGETEEARSKLAISPSGETILVVEDETVVRQTVAKCLRQIGYRILEACNGVEALALWEKHRDEINLLFTDVVMPEGISGLELAERFAREKPRLKILVGSGYSEQIARNGFHNGPGHCFLAKPYEPRSLVETIRRTLDQKTGKE